MPRFVILEHDHPCIHWDLMLEAQDVLRTWRLAAPPSNDVPIGAEASFDHRLLYLDYEGPVSGGRGRVVRWEWGKFDWLTEDCKGFTVRLIGQRLQGVLYLERQDKGKWQVTFRVAQVR
jgi:hypothetical protein